jgi:hypothetical protein
LQLKIHSDCYKGGIFNKSIASCVVGSAAYLGLDCETVSIQFKEWCREAPWSKAIDVKVIFEIEFTLPDPVGAETIIPNLIYTERKFYRKKILPTTSLLGINQFNIFCTMQAT